VHAVVILLCAATLVTAAACRRRPPPPAPDVAALLGDEEIRYGEFQAYLSRSVGDADTTLGSDVLSELFDQFLDERLLLRLAADRGLTTAGPAPHEARLAIDALLRQAERPAVGGGAASSAPGVPPQPALPVLPAASAAEIAAYYQKHPAEFARPERVRLRQILTEDRRTAERAEWAIRQGEDFAAVARRISHDASAAGGGYQGELARADLPPALVDVIFALHAGEVSHIVPAEYGFHLFQVVERLPAQVVPLAEASGEISLRLQRERADRALTALVRQARGRYNVKVYERNLPFEYEGSYGENPKRRPTNTETSDLSADPAAL
jgi:hypothetical protein